MKPTVMGACEWASPLKPPSATAAPTPPAPLSTSRRLKFARDICCSCGLPLIAVLEPTPHESCPAACTRRGLTSEHLLVYMQRLCQRLGLGQREGMRDAAGCVAVACAPCRVRRSWTRGTSLGRPARAAAPGGAAARRCLRSTHQLASCS